MPKLTKDHLVYIDKLWRRLREANLRTMEYDREWNEVNEELNAKYRAEGITNALQLVRLKEPNIALKDAFAACEWWRAKASWLATAILAEKAAVEMTQGGGQWVPPSSAR
jgi:hypothetical protein